MSYSQGTTPPTSDNPYAPPKARLEDVLPLQAEKIRPLFNADPFARALLDPEKKVAHWSEFADGGHFPAMEAPQLLVQDLRQFFGNLAQ